MRILFTLVTTLFLFAQSNAQDWSEVMKVIASDRASEDAYGQSVSVSGKYAIVGAYLEDEDASGGNSMSGAGSAYVLERDDGGNWIEAQKIVSSDRTAGDKFGFSVSISGNYAIVGASGEDHDLNGGGLAFDAGAAYIFERDGNGTWTELHKIVASDRAAQDLFGFSVSVSGDYAVVGAYSEDHDASGGDTKSLAGSAYIFQNNGDGTWSQVQKIVASDREPGDRFGYSVSIDNDRIISGAYFEDHDVSGENTIDEAGSAYIFERDGGGTWNEVQKIVAPERFEDDNFGRSVSINGDYVISGAHMEDQDASEGGNMVDAGSAYIYERDGGGVWSLAQKAVASDRAAGDNFGVAVSISDKNAVIGAWLAESEAGASYIFERDDSGVWAEAQILTASDKVNGDRFGVAVSISNAYVIIGAHFKEGGGAAYIFKSSVISSTKDNFPAESLIAYPNPTGGAITIDLGEIYSGVDLTVSNIMGQVVFTRDFGTTEQLSFDIDGVPGIYIVGIHTEEGRSATLKVLKQ
jgi:FG-GAP repeat/Secretion system C-terminal sorting domain